MSAEENNKVAAIRNSWEFTDVFSRPIADLAAGKVTASTANAMCDEGAQLLRMVERQTSRRRSV